MEKLSSDRFVTAAALGFALAIAPPALAYRTNSGLASLDSTTDSTWPWAHYAFDMAGAAPDDLDIADVENTVLSALGAWSEPSCTSWSVEYQEYSDTPAIWGDGRNTVQWVTAGWETVTSHAEAASVTSLGYEEVSDGIWSIVEADIYLNAQDYAWSTAQPAPEGTIGLRSALLHEGGHVLGLLHPCEPGGDGGVPDCADSADYDAVAMNPMYSPALTGLSPDDMAGACFLYPASEYAVEPPAPGWGGEGGASNTWAVSAGGFPAFVDEACSGDDDCARGLRCTAGHCALGAGVEGDPCTVDTDCATTLCDPAGRCARLCFDTTDCREGSSCVVADESAAPFCAGEALPFGVACEDGSDCLSGLCLTENPDRTVCTRTCGHADAPCPLGWTCRSVDRSPVCVPPEEEPSSECTCTAPRTPDSRTNVLWPLLLAGAAITRRHRSRCQHHGQ